jgi:hypothetical protein
LKAKRREAGEEVSEDEDPDEIAQTQRYQAGLAEVIKGQMATPYLTVPEEAEAKQAASDLREKLSNMYTDSSEDEGGIEDVDEESEIEEWSSSEEAENDEDEDDEDEEDEGTSTESLTYSRSGFGSGCVEWPPWPCGSASWSFDS